MKLKMFEASMVVVRANNDNATQDEVKRVAFLSCVDSMNYYNSCVYAAKIYFNYSEMVEIMKDHPTYNENTNNDLINQFAKPIRNKMRLSSIVSDDLELFK